MIDRIIGVDCATDPKKVGLALVERSADSLCLISTACSSGSPAREIAAWLQRPGRTLLALDAPLGWPAAMGSALSRHEAGETLADEANYLFRRDTDRKIHARFKKTPLEVGADRIARTAHWALRLLGELRSLLNQTIPIAWSRSFEERVAAIEVYPAATMIANGVSIRGYKSETGHAVRAEIHKVIQLKMLCHGAGDPQNWSIDALDAAVCAVAGVDFLEGRAVGPEDATLARKEGWIWA